MTSNMFKFNVIVPSESRVVVMSCPNLWENKQHLLTTVNTILLKYEKNHAVVSLMDTVEYMDDDGDKVKLGDEESEFEVFKKYCMEKMVDINLFVSRSSWQGGDEIVEVTPGIKPRFLKPGRFVSLSQYKEEKKKPEDAPILELGVQANGRKTEEQYEESGLGNCPMEPVLETVSSEPPTWFTKHAEQLKQDVEKSVRKACRQEITTMRREWWEENKRFDSRVDVNTLADMLHEAMTTASNSYNETQRKIELVRQKKSFPEKKGLSKKFSTILKFTDPSPPANSSRRDNACNMDKTECYTCYVNSPATPHTAVHPNNDVKISKRELTVSKEQSPVSGGCAACGLYRHYVKAHGPDDGNADNDDSLANNDKEKKGRKGRLGISVDTQCDTTSGISGVNELKSAEFDMDETDDEIVYQKWPLSLFEKTNQRLLLDNDLYLIYRNSLSLHSAVGSPATFMCAVVAFGNYTNRPLELMVNCPPRLKYTIKKISIDTKKTYKVYTYQLDFIPCDEIKYNVELRVMSNNVRCGTVVKLEINGKCIKEEKKDEPRQAQTHISTMREYLKFLENVDLGRRTSESGESSSIICMQDGDDTTPTDDETGSDGGYLESQTGKFTKIKQDYDDNEKIKRGCDDEKIKQGCDDNGNWQIVTGKEVKNVSDDAKTGKEVPPAETKQPPIAINISDSEIDQQQHQQQHESFVKIEKEKGETNTDGWEDILAAYPPLPNLNSSALDMASESVDDKIQPVVEGSATIKTSQSDVHTDEPQSEETNFKVEETNSKELKNPDNVAQKINILPENFMETTRRAIDVLCKMHEVEDRKEYTNALDRIMRLYDTYYAEKTGKQEEKLPQRFGKLIKEAGQSLLELNPENYSSSQPKEDKSK